MKFDAAILVLASAVYQATTVEALTSPPYQATAHHEQTFLERRATSPPYQATAHHEQTFLDRRAVVPQSHADLFTLRHQSLERREFIPVPFGVTIAPKLDARAYVPVPVGFAKAAPATLDRRGYLPTHVAAHREPTFAHLERRAPQSQRKTRQKKKQVKKRVVKKKKKPIKSLSQCINELRRGFPAYDNLQEATSVYHHALSMFPEQLIADAKSNQDMANDITLGLQSARTYLVIARMQAAEDHIAWRKALVLGQVTWLSAKIQLALRLTKKIKPMPQLKWLEKAAKSVSEALEWLWGKKETREARKKQMSMSGTEKKATKNLKTWLDSATAQLNKEGSKLTSTLCNRLIG